MNAMQTIFARSGNLPVVASLEFPYDFLSREDHITRFCEKTVVSRIRMLHVQSASPTWLKEHIPSYINLDLLCLDHYGWSGTESVVIDSPCTRLALKSFSCGIHLSWSKIEVLHLSGMLTYDCLELLKKCPRLREYRVRDPDYSGLGGWQLPSSPFILPFLELFEWTADDADPVDRAMLKYIRMPALRTLVWNEDFPNLKPSDFLSAFFEHPPSTLSVVQLQRSRTSSNFSIFSYILSLPSVERLTFKGCCGSFMDDVFSDLGSKTCLIKDQEVPVLPKLKSIHVDRLNGNFDQARVLQALQRTCSRPLELLQGSQFRLEFANHQVHWMPESKEELIRMAEKGYKVELWEDSEAVDWLPR